LSTPALDIALVHHPVVNRDGEAIASAVTNLDLHDIARAAKTYGVVRYYVVTPLEDQQKLAQKIVGHWTQGRGGRVNPDRKEALELIRVVDSVEQAIDRIEKRCGRPPKTIATCAAGRPYSIGYSRLRAMLDKGTPCLLLFGTAWGLSNAFIEGVDCVLDPVRGRTPYNHLSVRSAVSIVLDRLVGERDI